MQQNHKQHYYQIQNKTITNRLTYHLKKIQPYHTRSKKTITQQMKSYNKNDKVSTITNNNHYIKKYLWKLNKNLQDYQMENINQQHTNLNTISISSQVKIYQTPTTIRKNALDRGNSDIKAKKLDLVQRGKSLKYWKVQKTQPKIVQHIKGWLNTLFFQDDGCNCGAYCQCRQVLLKWINVTDELINRNYKRLLNIAYKNQNDKSQKNIRNGMTKTSYYTDNSYWQQPQSIAQKNQQRNKNRIQIQKDVIRTQTQCQLFHNQSTQNKMERILMCYTVEDPQVGYVQSMNMVMSGVLYHVRDQAKTYAICRKLFHEIRKIYLKDFKQCYQHVNHIIKLFQTHIYDLYQHLQQIGVQLKVILFPWILSLMCVVIPLKYLHLIYLGFVTNSWKFIYKIVLAVYVYHKQKLIYMNQSQDVLVFLSISNKQGKQSVDWENIIKFAQEKIYI